MNPDLDADEFLRLSRSQRIAKCRQMAVEAERLAAGKRTELRASYLTLAEKWSDLANEMERLDGE